MSNTSNGETTLQSGNDENQEGTPALWNPTTICALSTIFSPVLGSILVLLNWQALGIKEKIGNTKIWLTISIIILVVVSPIIWPISLSIYLIYLIIWYLYLVKPQANYISQHWKQAYIRRGGLWLFGFLTGFFVSGASWFGFVYLRYWLYNSSYYSIPAIAAQWIVIGLIIVLPITVIVSGIIGGIFSKKIYSSRKIDFVLNNHLLITIWCVIIGSVFPAILISMLTGFFIEYVWLNV